MDWAAEAAKFGGSIDAPVDWAKEAAKFGGTVSARPKDALDDPNMAKASMFSDALRSGAGGLRDLGMGAINGASFIGRMLLRPLDAAGGTGTTTDERKAAADAFMKENADPSSLGFKEGEIAAQVAGTAGMGGALAQGIRAFPLLAKFAPAIESGGFSLGKPAATTLGGKAADMATRVGAGAVVGGASAGLVNPDDAGTGAVIGGVLPMAAKAAGALGAKANAAAAAGAVEKSQNATRDATLKAGQDAGYVVPPSTVNPTLINQTLESVGGKASVGQAASIQNQKVTNALARKELGLTADAPLSDKLLEDYRLAVSGPYKEVAALPAMPPQRTTGIGGYPLIGAAQKPPAEALNDLKQARFDANAYWNEYRRTGEVAARDKATALSKTADGLETYLEQTAIAAGKPGLVDALRAARQKIAKSYTVEGALNTSTGDVSARDLAKMLNRGKPLGGSLETAARFADAFPKANQDVAPIGSQGVSKVAATISTLLAGGGFAAGGPGTAAIAAALPFVAPAAAGKLVLSKSYQGAMATPGYGSLLGNAGQRINSMADLAGNPALRTLAYDKPNRSSR